MSEQYQTLFKNVEQLSENERDDLVELYLTYYEGSSFDQVILDLEEKTEVILLFENQVLVGFTTLKVYLKQWQKETIQVIFSGDTIVDKKHWGQQALNFACISRIGFYTRQKENIASYWFLIVKGYRTYKFLPAFMSKFYPHWQYESSSLKAIADYLAQDRYGAMYNKVSGVIEFSASHGYLKHEFAYPKPAEINKPAVNYFLTKNPNYLMGHELVCLCQLSEDYMKQMTKRIFNKLM